MVRIAVALGLLATGTGLAMAAAPSQLRGKSITLRWNENRVQRIVGHSDFKTVTINLELAVYVSTEGRVFNRMQSNSGASEQAPGQPVSGDRITSFSGQRMTIHQALRGLARQIVIDFDGGFAGCKVAIIVGKESGAESGYIRAFGTGVRQEVKSVAVSGATCSVRSGNVFQ